MGFPARVGAPAPALLNSADRLITQRAIGEILPRIQIQPNIKNVCKITNSLVPISRGVWAVGFDKSNCNVRKNVEDTQRYGGRMGSPERSDGPLIHY